MGAGGGAPGRSGSAVGGAVARRLVEGELANSFLAIDLYQ